MLRDDRKISHSRCFDLVVDNKKFETLVVARLS